jgi:predicted transposase/invertase (TIGR01784 family)
MAEILRHIDRAGGRDYVSIVLQYVLERGEMSDKQAFFRLIKTQVSPEVGEKVMSLAEQLVAEGVQKGMQKGIQKGIQQGMQQGVEQRNIEIAMRLLEEGVEVEFIAKITELPLFKIRELQEA